jgi:hypothetical protein
MNKVMSVVRWVAVRVAARVAARVVSEELAGVMAH